MDKEKISRYLSLAKDIFHALFTDEESETEEGSKKSFLQKLLPVIVLFYVSGILGIAVDPSYDYYYFDPQHILASYLFSAKPYGFCILIAIIYIAVLLFIRRSNVLEIIRETREGMGPKEGQLSKEGELTRSTTEMKLQASRAEVQYIRDHETMKISTRPESILNTSSKEESESKSEEGSDFRPELSGGWKPSEESGQEEKKVEQTAEEGKPTDKENGMDSAEFIPEEELPEMEWEAPDDEKIPESAFQNNSEQEEEQEVEFLDPDPESGILPDEQETAVSDSETVSHEEIKAETEQQVKVKTEKVSTKDEKKMADTNIVHTKQAHHSRRSNFDQTSKS